MLPIEIIADKFLVNHFIDQLTVRVLFNPYLKSKQVNTVLNVNAKEPGIFPQIW